MYWAPGGRSPPGRPPASGALTPSAVPGQPEDSPPSARRWGIRLPGPCRSPAAPGAAGLLPEDGPRPRRRTRWPPAGSARRDRRSPPNNTPTGPLPPPDSGPSPPAAPERRPRLPIPTGPPPPDSAHGRRGCSGSGSGPGCRAPSRSPGTFLKSRVVHHQRQLRPVRRLERVFEIPRHGPAPPPSVFLRSAYRLLKAFATKIHKADTEVNGKILRDLIA